MTILARRIAPAPDPADAAARLAHLPWLMWLDSSADPDHLGRWSYLVADPSLMVRGEGSRTWLRQRGQSLWTETEGDVLAVLHRLLGERNTPSPAEGPPFIGGAVGYLAYDWGRVLERRGRATYDDLGLPDALFGVYDRVLAWDHAKRECWLVEEAGQGGQREAGRGGQDGEVGQEYALRTMGARGPSPAPSDSPVPPDFSSPASVVPSAPLTIPVPFAPSYPVLGLDGAEQIGLRSTFTHRGYLSAVQRVVEYIRAGDIFQANLSQRFDAPLSETPERFYLRLRTTNPAPFGAYLRCDDVTLLSVSPERFLKLEQGQVETRPIKGTRPRGVGPLHDAALGRELTESDKDRAENVMIVDLLRNDLSRVCRPGSVRVPALFALEHHPTVHHLVSTVTGQLGAGATAADLVRASFPGGSITGAPKVRAMQIIAELEPTERGVYCGAIVWLGRDGAMDSSIAIRTAVAHAGRLYFSAGGGIVADSDPELEYRETLDKVQGIVRTLANGAA